MYICPIVVTIGSYKTIEFDRRTIIPNDIEVENSNKDDVCGVHAAIHFQHIYGVSLKYI